MHIVKMETLLIVDHDRRFRDAQDTGQSVSPIDEAEKIALMANAFEARVQRVAFVSEHDPVGFQAYYNSDYETIPVNGNRNQILNERLAGWGKMLTKGGCISHLVVVSPDKRFEPLMLKAKQVDSAVHLWAPAEKIPNEMKRPFYNFRDIDEMFPKNLEIFFYVDYENLHITLERNGFDTNPTKIVNAIKSVASEFGKTIYIEAYADWGELEKHSRMDIQRKLAELGVNTHYLISHHGKNSADMRIVKDARDALERMTSQHYLQRIGLVSGDSDFRDLLYAIREHGKGTLVLGLKDSMSAGLTKAADEVRYLDDLLCATEQSGKKPDSPLSPSSSQVRLVAQMMKVLSSCQNEEMELQSLLKRSKINARQLAWAIEQKLLLIHKGQKNGKTLRMISLNKQNQVVSILEYLAHWVPDHIARALSKGLPWVDSNYLANGMKADEKFQLWKIGQDRRDADGWLAIVELMGLMAKQIQAHPNTPKHKVTTWVLSGYSAI